ncbi:hypothetical protein QF031_001461 [Pseudarthrobacter defluvii]|nr:hypothetical protein [Pseudarthrobacter defluvii]MDQ0768712.1 hypothetical protein [Pseudarthrobacter defluvii]
MRRQGLFRSTEEGVLPGGQKVDVKKPDGTLVAALWTGLPASS